MKNGQKTIHFLSINPPSPSNVTLYKDQRSKIKNQRSKINNTFALCFLKFEI